MKVTALDTEALLLLFKIIQRPPKVIEIVLLTSKVTWKAHIILCFICKNIYGHLLAKLIPVMYSQSTKFKNREIFQGRMDYIVEKY